MKILLLRHAHAGDRDEFEKTGKTDSLRPLDKRGHEDMVRVSHVLRQLLQVPDLIVSSTLVRAKETAQYLTKIFPESDYKTTSALSPEGPIGDLLGFVESLKVKDLLVLVGHEPQLSGFISWALSGHRDEFVELKKGGFALMEFPNGIKAGEAVLYLLLQPRDLKKMTR